MNIESNLNSVNLNVCLDLATVYFLLHQLLKVFPIFEFLPNKYSVKISTNSKIPANAYSWK